MSSENELTKEAILHMSQNFDPSSGIGMVCAYENQNFLSRISMRGKEVLELGCGCLPASFGIADDAMPNRYLATDTEFELIDAARKIDSRPDFKVTSALNTSLKESSFDLIILRGVLHHLPDPRAALESFKFFLKPDGHILLYEPNLSCIPGNLAKWILLTFFNKSMEESPYGQLKQKTLRKAFAEANLRIQEEWYTSLLAFQLTGDYGRLSILPNSRILFRAIILIDRFFSKLLHVWLPLAKITHWRVIFQLRKQPFPHN